jgi:signal transduction histidine kinase
MTNDPLAPTHDASNTPEARPQRRFAATLQVQLMLGTVLPMALLLVALVVVGGYAFDGITQTLVEERDSELVQLAAQQVANYWADSVLILNQVAVFDEVRRGDLVRAQDWLNRYEPILRYFDQVSLTNPAGTVVVTVGGQLGDAYGDLGAFERARRLRRPVRSELFTVVGGQAMDAETEGASATQKRGAAIAVAVPVYDVYGQFAGCVLGVWQLSNPCLGRPVNEVRVGESGYAYLVDHHGIVLSHPDPDWVGSDYGQHPAVEALLRSEVGTRTLTSAGERVVSGYAPIPLRHLTGSLLADETWDGWGLVTVERWSDIIAPVQPFAHLISALLAAVIILPLLVLTISGRRIVAPLQSLVAQTERIASGELETGVSVNSGPLEVRDLELAFNVMVGQLRKSREAIQSYVVSVLNGQEDERKRVARELHDETAQDLIVLGREIEQAAELATKPELKLKLAELRDMVDGTLEGVRRFSRDLRPPLLAELGLPRSLEILGSRTEREGAQRVTVMVEGEPRALLPEFELALYRLAQESLNNVRRHAQASEVQLRLAYEAERVTLQVQDNGVGFAAPTDWSELLKQGQLGLMGIHERARLFGGKATISSTPGRGTMVTIEVPFSPIVLADQHAPKVEQNGSGGAE